MKSSYFQMGKKWHTEDFSDYIPPEREKEVLQKYVNKYWGDVSKEQWDQNEMMISGNTNEYYDIIGKYYIPHYRDNDVMVEILIITLADNSYTVCMTGSEYDSGHLEVLKNQFRNNPPKQKKKTTEDMLNSSIRARNNSNLGRTTSS